jgi:hypothetical protein
LDIFSSLPTADLSSALARTVNPILPSLYLFMGVEITILGAFIDFFAYHSWVKKIGKGFLHARPSPALSILE